MASKIDFRKLIGDPTYQTNLLLWLLIPSTGAIVEPLLYKAGYRLKYLEPELPLPVELIADLADKKVPHRQAVSPDLLITSSANDYVTLECKSRMFGSQVQPGSGDSQQKQARSLLLLAPPILASAINLPKKEVTSNHILYLSQHEPQHPQTKGLQDLSEELQKLKYRTAPFGLLGLEATGKKIILRSNYQPGQLPVKLDKAIGKKGAPLQQLTDDVTDPRPLYYIPWLPDTTPDDDEYSHSAFEQRIYAAAVAQIGPRRPPCEVFLEVDQLLASATNNLYGQWRSRDIRKRLQKRTVDLLRKSIGKFMDGEPVQSVSAPKGIRFMLVDEKSQGRVIEGLRKTEVKDWNLPLQPGLFDQEDGAE